MYIKATYLATPGFPRISAQHLAWWSKGGLGTAAFQHGPGRTSFINFLEPVSFRMIATMRANGVSIRDIRLANNLLREKWGWPYPFAMQQVWVGSPDLFVEIQDTPVAVTRFWQSALDIVRRFLIPVSNEFHGLSFDEDQMAIAWRPWERILLDPSMQFGEPCIEGTRVPTETVWSFYQAGDSVDYLAQMYQIPPDMIEAAIGWEKRLAEYSTK